MSSRSWTAVLAVAVGLSGGWPVGLSGARAGSEIEDDAPVTRSTVSLQLQITGLAAGESVIEIKPGHPACSFPTVTRTVRSGVDGGMLRLEPIVVEALSQGADRDCSFAITIREPGQKPQTFRRGIRLSTSEDGSIARPQTLKLYLSAPSVAARESTPRT